MRYLPYVFKSAFRNPLRTCLTMFGIAMSLALLTTLYAYIHVTDELSEYSKLENRLVVQHAQSITTPLPVAYLDRVREIPGVVDAVQILIFGGQYADERIPFPQFATDPDHLFTVFPDYKVPPDQLVAWKADRAGAVAGRQAAAKRGWRIGDRIRIKGVQYPFDADLTLRGIYEGPEEGYLWFQWPYFDELAKAHGAATGLGGVIWAKVRDHAQVPAVAQTIDAQLSSSEWPTRTMTEEAFKAMLVEMVGNVRAFVGTMGMAIGFALVLMAANGMAMSIRERTGEIAVLRAMGYGRWHVMALVLAEAVFISAAGGVLGIVGTKIFFAAFDLTRYVTILYFYVPTYTMVVSMCMAIAIGLSSGALPAWRAASLGVADGLRRVV